MLGGKIQVTEEVLQNGTKISGCQTPVLCSFAVNFVLTFCNVQEALKSLGTYLSFVLSYN